MGYTTVLELETRGEGIFDWKRRMVSHRTTKLIDTLEEFIPVRLPEQLGRMRVPCSIYLKRDYDGKGGQQGAHSIGLKIHLKIH